MDFRKWFTGLCTSKEERQAREANSRREAEMRAKFTKNLQELLDIVKSVTPEDYKQLKKHEKEAFQKWLEEQKAKGITFGSKEINKEVLESLERMATDFKMSFEELDARLAYEGGKDHESCLGWVDILHLEAIDDEKKAHIKKCTRCLDQLRGLQSDCLPWYELRWYQDWYEQLNSEKKKLLFHLQYCSFCGPRLHLDEPDE